MEVNMSEETSFRDRIATVDEHGHRHWIYPKKPSGKHTNRRFIVAAILLLILFGVPFVKVGGHPLFMFNIPERRFIVFGMAFWPQDLHIFAVGLMSIFTFIILFTSVYGRLWCGWACPQTIFMEMVFRPIEYLIEGDALAQKKLNKEPWGGEKAFKKVGKQLIFFFLSFLVGNMLLAWIIGVDALYAIVTDDPRNHIKGLTAMLAFTGIFWFVFGWFREQACVVVCPYARLQAVLIDGNSQNVTYDFKRGEPRGKRNPKNPEPGLGDCVDCKQCVAVCPTGIDIRNGAQLECVNCTACIDACDNIMSKLNFAPGLIRHASHNEVETGIRKVFTNRNLAYAVVFTLVFSILLYLVATRPPVEVNLTRIRGMLELKLPDGRIANAYTLRVLNKTLDPATVTLSLKEQPEGVLQTGTASIEITPHEFDERTIQIIFPQDHFQPGAHPVEVEVHVEEQLVETVKTGFLISRKE